MLLTLQILGQIVSTTQHYSAKWLGLVEESSADYHSEELRLAAAQSLSSSGLLKCQDDSAVLYTLRGWLVCLRQLQDDDEDVREVSRINVLSQVDNKEVVGEYCLLQQLPHALSLVIGRAVLIADSIDSVQDVVNTLGSAIAEYGKNSVSVMHVDNGISQSGQSSSQSCQIFDTEQSNLYIEPLYALHSIATAVELSVVSVLGQGPSAYVEEFIITYSNSIIEYVSRLLVTVESAAHKDSISSWIRVDGYSQDMFRMLHSALFLTNHLHAINAHRQIPLLHRVTVETINAAAGNQQHVLLAELLNILRRHDSK